MVLRILILSACLLALSGALADEPSIHSMLVGGKALELLDTRQLTCRAEGDVTAAWLSPDGKHVAYLISEKMNERLQPMYPENTRLYLIKSSGGRPAMLLESRSWKGEWNTKLEAWIADCPHECSTAWSPDGKLLAVTAKRVVNREEGYRDESYILVFGGNGASRARFPLPEGTRLESGVTWSPDSRRFAIVQAAQTADAAGHDLLVFDAVRGAVKTVFSDPRQVGVAHWSDGESLLIVSAGEGRSKKLREVHLDGRPDEIISENHVVPHGQSPDERLALVKGRSDIAVEDRATGKVLRVANIPPHAFRGWAPNSRMLVYQGSGSLRGEADGRQERLSSLWLASLETHKLNHMCVAVDSDGSRPTWSSDCLKLAHICDRRLYVAELGWRSATPAEKVAAGIPLSEDEEKDLMRDNAKQIGLAIIMYAQDWEGPFPSPDTFREIIYPYVKNKDVFFRPGTEDYIFKYLPQTRESEIEFPADTVIGILDAGYGWQIKIFADGHVELVPKE